MSIDTTTQNIGIAILKKGKYSLANIWGAEYTVINQVGNRITYESNSEIKNATVVDEDSGLSKAFSLDCFVILIELKKIKFIIPDSFDSNKIYTISNQSNLAHIEPTNDKGKGVIAFEQDAQKIQGYYELHKFLNHKKINYFHFESDIKHSAQFYIDKRGYLYQFKSDSTQLHIGDALDGHSKKSLINNLIGYWKTIEFEHNFDSLIFDPNIEFEINGELQLTEKGKNKIDIVYFRDYGSWSFNGHSKYLLQETI